MIRPVRADGRIDTGGVFTPIDRPRVVERIASAALHPIVMLVAPAGYGKSTALGQYVATLHERVVRYNVRSDGSTLLGFVRGFAEALVEIAPDARATVTGAYESSQSSPTPGTDLATWIHAHIKSHTGLIVIDDLHIAEGEPQVSQFLITLTELTKGRLRWIFASRSYLSLPVGSWMAYAQMDLAIDETELSFTSQEARQVARSSRVGVRDDELERLVAMTEGWPTALSFALRSSTRSLDLGKIEVATRDLVYRYLAEQVYTSLDEDQREFLTLAVLLPEIDVRVLNLAGYDNALARIEDLRHRGAFIAVEADNEGTYRCHDLFREFVRHQAERSGEARIRSSHQRAGAALEAAQRIPDALFAYTDALDGASILRILGKSGLDLMEAGNADVVARAIEVLDVRERSTNSVALAMRGIAESNAGRLDQAEALLHKASENASDPDSRIQFLLREARVAINRGNFDVRALLVEISDDSNVGSDQRLEAAAMLVVLQTRCGENAAAAELRGRVLSDLTRSSSAPVRARVLQRLALSLFEAGDGLGARDLYVRVVDDASELGLHSLASKACSALAAISRLYLRDPSQRLWYAQKASSAASKGGDSFDIQTTAILLLNIEVERGNAEQAEVLERKLGGLRRGDPSRMVLVNNARAERIAWSGEFDEAYRVWAQSWARTKNVGERIVDGAQCAIYAAASDHAAQSREICEQVEGIISAEIDRCAPHDLDTAILWLALAHAIAGRHTQAQRVLRRAVYSTDVLIGVLRRAVGVCIRQLRNPTVGAGDVEELSTELTILGRGGYGRLLRAVLDRCATASMDQLDGPTLTPTEAEVLRSLAIGLTPKEIAAETGRSFNTVKVHIQKAIQKLGCHGRQEAIATAQRLGLLG